MNQPETCAAAWAARGQITRTIRVISVEVADARMWRAEVRRHEHGQYTRPETIERVRQAYRTAELLGVPVGIIIGTREEVVHDL